MNSLKTRGPDDDRGELAPMPFARWLFPDQHNGQETVSGQGAGMVVFADGAIGYIRRSDTMPVHISDRLNNLEIPSAVQVGYTPYVADDPDKPLNTMRLSRHRPGKPLIGVEAELNLRDPAGELFNIVDNEGRPDGPDVVNKLIGGQPEAFKFMLELAIGTNRNDDSRGLANKLFKSLYEIQESLGGEAFLDPAASIPDAVPTLSDTNPHPYVRAIMLRYPELQEFTVSGIHAHVGSTEESQQDTDALLTKRALFERIAPLINFGAYDSPHAYKETNADPTRLLPGAEVLLLPKRDTVTNPLRGQTFGYRDLIKQLGAPSEIVGDTKAVDIRQLFRAADRQLQAGLVHSPDRASQSGPSSYGNTRARVGIGADVLPRLEYTGLDNPAGSYERIELLLNLISSFSYIVDRIQTDEFDGISRIQQQYSDLFGAEDIDEGSGRHRVLTNSMQLAVEGPDAVIVDGNGSYTQPSSQIRRLLEFMSTENARIKERQGPDEITPFDRLNAQRMTTIMGWFEPVPPSKSLEDFFEPGSIGVASQYINNTTARLRNEGMSEADILRYLNDERVQAFNQHLRETRQRTMVADEATKGLVLAA
jgi:hypothetical protein